MTTEEECISTIHQCRDCGHNKAGPQESCPDCDLPTCLPCDNSGHRCNFVRRVPKPTPIRMSVDDWPHLPNTEQIRGTWVVRTQILAADLFEARVLPDEVDEDPPADEDMFGPSDVDALMSERDAYEGAALAQAEENHGRALGKLQAELSAAKKQAEAIAADRDRAIAERDEHEKRAEAIAADRDSLCRRLTEAQQQATKYSELLNAAAYKRDLYRQQSAAARHELAQLKKAVATVAELSAKGEP